ncbi:hypothetical protein [Pseudomonas luteola]|uniref:Alpha/beta hydrolase n=1 Tax=Pseudomonas luteola TaxID=47886 RepID=A0ABS0MYS3_PSELU|nr:hypothetical protein [Pseudomonas luteola]MBH3441834.1 hypothetical protein [Pseudomonas luteola]
MKLYTLIILAIMVGCTRNAQYRTNDEVACLSIFKACSSAGYEKYDGFEIGYVEYSERGNDFNPNRTRRILKKLKSSVANNERLAIIIYTPGWKHNSEEHDSNVFDFKQSMQELYDTEILPRDYKLVGLYIGWRGKSLIFPKTISYWDRKEVAEEVGRGGLTELFLNINEIDSMRKDNIMLTVGHSFGGAMVLSSLNDILLSKLIDGQNGRVVKGIGNSIVLLNPAIEANQGLTLKENSMKLGVSQTISPTILYVISSKGDTATHTAFPLGQMLGVSATWKQAILERDYLPKGIQLKESTMDVTTIGNYELFRTGEFYDESEASNTNTALSIPILSLLSATPSFQGYDSYCYGAVSRKDVVTIPCNQNEAIEFLYTPKSLIKDHNDIFNPAVKGLLAAIINKSLYEEASYYGDSKFNFEPCLDRGKFNFGECMSHYRRISEDYKKLINEQFAKRANKF